MFAIKYDILYILEPVWIKNINGNKKYQIEISIELSQSRFFISG